MQKSINILRSVGRKARSIMDYAVIASLTGYGVIFVLEVARLQSVA